MGLPCESEHPTDCSAIVTKVFALHRSSCAGMLSTFRYFLLDSANDSCSCSAYYALRKYDERITSRGLSACTVCSARVAWKNSEEISQRKMPRTFSGSFFLLQRFGNLFCGWARKRAVRQELYNLLDIQLRLFSKSGKNASRFRRVEFVEAADVEVSDQAIKEARIVRPQCSTTIS